jgi:sarcosine oxidase subunit gamma
MVRAGALQSRGLLEAKGKLAMRALPAAARLLLRGGVEAAERAGAVLGLPIPLVPCRASERAERAALWLGPDEWLLLAPEAETADLLAAQGSALAGLPHALTDVGHRQAGIELAGPLAAETLNAGCPLDLELEAFPVSMCTRTLLGKAEVVLWRREAGTFHVEVQRSLASYAWRFLEEAAREHWAG